jgi:hypothetical protein
MTQMATVPSLEERDFQAINAALQVIEAIVLTRGHLPRTDRFLVELQKSIAWERRALEEKGREGAAATAPQRARTGLDRRGDLRRITGPEGEPVTPARAGGHWS